MDSPPPPPSPDPPGVPIGKAAAILGTTAKAIRTYHARGLVPEPARDASGYRRYDPATLVRLARVRRLRGLGLSLEAIGPLLAGGDGGAALRAELRRLDGQLAEEARRLQARRGLIAGLLEEGVDDPIAVSAADVWEEVAVSWLRRTLPDMTPEEELSERRFQRAMSALMPLDAAPPPDLPTLDVEPALVRRVGLAHRAFHALAGAQADDPRIVPLVPEMTAAIGEVMRAAGPPGAADAPPEPPPAGEEDAALLHTAMAAAFEILSPAQRRVMESVLEALLAETA